MSPKGFSGPFGNILGASHLELVWWNVFSKVPEVFYIEPPIRDLLRKS